ncbi:hypothetical protein [Chania multitudinisentens]|uniref:hypothetical protein n=1 Tax=Chania multitudinisentens TaxID=1639108 RepID=UPI00192E3174|nr:hypothetical protein [Chania multitudinisentens]
MAFEMQHALNINRHEDDQRVDADRPQNRQFCSQQYLAISQGKIVATGSSQPPDAEKVIDASDKWVIPGVIDGQVHSGSQANQEGLGWASRAAAAGGITVMVDMPYDDPEPVASRVQLDNKIAEVERDCHVDVALFGTLNQKHGLKRLRD